MHAQSGALERDNTIERDSERESEASAMPTRTLLGELQPRPDASPGLMRRRYSVPETIMRKYRLAQQSSDSEESGAPGGGAWSAYPSPSRDSACSGGESPSPRHLRRDRELMRKSALLRRMWARPTPAAPSACSCERETRSLDGSRDELHEGDGGGGPRTRWPEPKRQRLALLPPSSGDLTDSTCNPDLSSYLETTDALSEKNASASPLGTASTARPTATEEKDARAPPGGRSRSFEDSDSFSTSISTAKETPRHMEGLVSAGEPIVENGESNAMSSERPLAQEVPAPYEVLEICVSESTAGTQPPPPASRAPQARPPRDMNIDEYVSQVLVESLASLSDRLEHMSAAVAGAGDARLNVVEKEIKVRLQNAAVNTVVHLSPTSNHQIIFGNEELCDHRIRDECNNLRTIRFHERECERDNNNASPSASPSPPFHSETFDTGGAVLQHDNVNQAVLHQIQKLFLDGMQHSESEASLHCGEHVSHVQVCDVDVFLDSGAGVGGDTIEVRTRGADESIGGVGAGNYYRDAGGATLVPRFSAFPHSASMEVNTSSSSEAEPDALGSDCASLVDSLDDPNSPRGAGTGASALLRHRVPELVRSSVDVLALLPEHSTSCASAGKAFFVGIRDDEPAPDSERARVAEYMPERIRQKLHRRHRKRELRMECVRRGKVRQLKEELERRRRDEMARARRDLDRECAALVDALLDDVIAKVAQDEYGRMRHARATRRHCEETLERRKGRRDLEIARNGDLQRNGKREIGRRHSDECGRTTRRAERHQVHGKLVTRPSVAGADAGTDAGPRRIYQKSEIREGDKCIEILEILEFASAAHSSPESTASDEAERGRARRSRIPVPTMPAHDHMRLTGGAALLLHAAAATAAAAAEPRDRSHSLRFKRVFDMIPEERASLSLDSIDADDAEDVEAARRASAPDLMPPPVPLTMHTRSAATSPPPAPAEARRLRNQTTMTSPLNKSVATSPLRAPTLVPPPVRPPRLMPPREGIVCALRPPPHRTASLAVE